MDNPTLSGLDMAGLSDEVLDALRIEVLTEQERRDRCAQLPDDLAAMTRTALAAGVSAEQIREAIGDAIDTAPAPAALETEGAGA